MTFIYMKRYWDGLGSSTVVVALGQTAVILYLFLNTELEDNLHDSIKYSI